MRDIMAESIVSKKWARDKGNIMSQIFKRHNMSIELSLQQPFVAKFDKIASNGPLGEHWGSAHLLTVFCAFRILYRRSMCSLATNLTLSPGGKDFVYHEFESQLK